MSYQDTSLWKRTLGKEDPNVEPLKNSFLRAREHAEFLLGKIRNDFENLTVHDITHVDSLWTVADTIIGEDYPINPLEGYILGIAFLIHDAALSYDTVGGKDKLRDSIEWKDAYADGANGKDEDDFKKECDFTAIRTLHARKAENILFEMFVNQNGTTFYIVDNNSIRTHYGELIGKIAASHHWDIDDISTKLKDQVNPRSGFPKKWIINAQKLACILRCADAGHIDNGRAPDSIFESLQVNGVSRAHWAAQNHLGQVCEDEDDNTLLRITASNPFPKEEFAAWNVAYEAIQIFDNEIKASNELLKAKRLEFPHKGVSGASSRELLARHIETIGWEPCNFYVHASNVKTLIEVFGGQQLYGEDYPLLVVLRELIQNARDAIKAKMSIDDFFQDGRIKIRCYEDGEDRIIEVMDNGIGMSKNCIKNHLLNFGSSYWPSSLSKYEYPGLRSSGFSSIGKYGIGFYSVFMVAKTVEVFTQKKNSTAMRIDFPNGLTLSPIMSRCEFSDSLSTIVRITLKDSVYDEFFLNVPRLNHSTHFYMSDIIKVITAGLDVNVFVKDEKFDTDYICVHTDISSTSFDKTEWLRGLTPLLNEDEIQYPDLSSTINQCAQNLEVIRDKTGQIRAILAVPSLFIFENETYPGYPSITTVGGLSSSLEDNFEKSYIGFIDFKEQNVSRNDTTFDEDLQECLQQWAIKCYDQDYEIIINSAWMESVYYELFRIFGINEKVLYINNRRRIYESLLDGEDIVDIGTLNGLSQLHHRLYCGLYKGAGAFQINVNVNSSQSSLDEMPEKSFEDVVSKFIYAYNWAYNYRIFNRGKERCLKIWMDLMLHRLMRQIIDWSSINNDVMFPKYQMNNNDLTSICVFLRNHLKPTEELYGKGIQ